MAISDLSDFADIAKEDLEKRRKYGKKIKHGCRRRIGDLLQSDTDGGDRKGNANSRARAETNLFISIAF